MLGSTPSYQSYFPVAPLLLQGSLDPRNQGRRQDDGVGSDGLMG